MHDNFEIKSNFEDYKKIFLEENSKHNLISKNDEKFLYEKHIYDSLSINLFLKKYNIKQAELLDIGCGGGFPGIPLAILFPEANFHLVDSIGKKVRVAQEVATAIGLKNVRFSHARAEEIKDKYDFVVTRAVMSMVDLIKIARKNIAKEQHNALPNGIIALKGGELDGEIAAVKNIAAVWPLSDYFEEEYFETKKVVHVGITSK